MNRLYAYENEHLLRTLAEGSVTVGDLKKAIANLPDEMPLISHSGHTWTDDVLVKVSSSRDPENDDEAYDTIHLSVIGKI
jgi:hypothetical protein